MASWFNVFSWFSRSPPDQSSTTSNKAPNPLANLNPPASDEFKSLLSTYHEKLVAQLKELTGPEFNMNSTLFEQIYTHINACMCFTVTDVNGIAGLGHNMQLVPRYRKLKEKFECTQYHKLLTKKELDEYRPAHVMDKETIVKNLEQAMTASNTLRDALGEVSTLLRIMNDVIGTKSKYSYLYNDFQKAIRVQLKYKGNPDVFNFMKTKKEIDNLVSQLDELSKYLNSLLNKIYRDTIDINDALYEIKPVEKFLQTITGDNQLNIEIEDALKSKNIRTNALAQLFKFKEETHALLDAAA